MYTSCPSLYQEAVKVYRDVKVNPIASAVTGSEWLTLRSGTLYSFSNGQLSFLLTKTNRHTEFKFYWYYDSTEFHPAPGSTRSPNCINYTNADVRLRTPDDGQKDCPKHVES